MLLESNLRLLLGQLDRLAETPYFTPQLDRYIAQLRSIPKRLLERLAESPPINPGLANYIEKNLWSLSQFLTGSTTKQIPYEVVFAVSEAAKQWTKVELMVTTAIIQEPNFYFKSVPEDFFDAVRSELGIVVDSRPVQVALPYIYRHKPLYCVPLFHELGHYVDSANEVVKTSMLISPPEIGPDLPDFPPAAQIAASSPAEQDNLRWVTENHRSEYFADLFAAMYVGGACADFLQQFAPSQPLSATHPATAARQTVVEDFLTGRPNPLVDLFQVALGARGMQPLRIQFRRPPLSEVFGQVRPITPASTDEVFGLLEAAWRFLQDLPAGAPNLWAALPDADHERIANDLAEKSIRNWMVVEGWRASSD